VRLAGMQLLPLRIEESTGKGCVCMIMVVRVHANWLAGSSGILNFGSSSSSLQHFECLAQLISNLNSQREGDEWIIRGS
jgi:hypothetical protein